MRKLIMIPRKWGVTWARKAAAAFDDLFSGGTPFTPIPLPPPFSSGAAREYDRMREQQDYAYRMAFGGRQAAYMGGFGGPLLARLMGDPYANLRVAGFSSALQEGKVNVQVKLTRIDEAHVLVEVECIKRIVHNAKELRELTAKLIETHAEEFLFSELAKKDIQLAKQPRERGGDRAGIGAKEPVEEKIGHE